jgi:hypothetical protein
MFSRDYGSLVEIEEREKEERRMVWRWKKARRTGD